MKLLGLLTIVGMLWTQPSYRSFYMGFTPWHPDITPEVMEQTYRFLDAHADLVAHHFDEGIPWQEALDKKPYHPKVEENLRFRVQKLNKEQKVLLSVTPLPVSRDGLAGHWAQETNMPRQGKWKDKDFDDPEVLAAYLNFCRDLIRRFHPDFMVYGIEVNLLANKKPQQWSKFVPFIGQVYKTLKAENPNLPLMLSVQIDEFWLNEKNQRKAVAEILPYSDYVAVSTYPYIFGHADPNAIPKGFFSQVAALAPHKPFAVAETGFIAEDMHAFGLKRQGSEEGQDAYVNLLMKECDKLNARFVVWFVSRDYDALFEKVKALGAGSDVLELFKLWKDCGLADGKYNPRKALSTWDQWLKLPKK